MNLAALNASAKKRCVYFDTKQNVVSDQGILTNFNPTTGLIECQAFHLTDFCIEEYDPFYVGNKMPANLEKVNVFHPLAIASTTPVSFLIIFAIITGALVPYVTLKPNILLVSP